MDYKPTMASWRSGYAADCKSVYSGSNPDEASSSRTNAAKGPVAKLQRDGRQEHDTLPLRAFMQEYWPTMKAPT